MKIVDSACFDPRLLREGQESGIFIHDANPDDPGTQLLVNGTISAFDFLDKLYQALGCDSRRVIPLHEVHIRQARREVNYLEKLWQTVINKAKRRLNTVEKRFDERLAEEETDEEVLHLSVPDTLKPGKPNTWLFNLKGSMKPPVYRTRRSRRNRKGRRVFYKLNTDEPGRFEVETCITQFIDCP